jgi:hypothetical protein
LDRYRLHSNRGQGPPLARADGIGRSRDELTLRIGQRDRDPLGFFGHAKTDVITRSQRHSDRVDLAGLDLLLELLIRSERRCEKKENTRNRKKGSHRVFVFSIQLDLTRTSYRSSNSSREPRTPKRRNW